MREIVLDTETTGKSWEQGDRIVEIGCVELENHMPTGRTYQQYLNPDKEMSDEVIAIHGITNEFVSDKPRFAEIADEFLAFIGTDAKLVIHNAKFDIGFLNMELSRCGKSELSFDRVIDTLLLARQKFPGARANLDALCKRFNVDASARTVHGALLDSELLSEVYLELIGGREPGLILTRTEKTERKKEEQVVVKQSTTPKKYREPRVFPIDEEELKEHIEFISKIKDNIWEIKHE